MLRGHRDRRRNLHPVIAGRHPVPDSLVDRVVFVCGLLRGGCGHGVKGEVLLAATSAREDLGVIGIDGVPQRAVLDDVVFHVEVRRKPEAVVVVLLRLLPLLEGPDGVAEAAGRLERHVVPARTSQADPVVRRALGEYGRRVLDDRCAAIRRGVRHSGLEVGEASAQGDGAVLVRCGEGGFAVFVDGFLFRLRVEWLHKLAGVESTKRGNVVKNEREYQRNVDGIVLDVEPVRGLR